MSRGRKQLITKRQARSDFPLARPIEPTTNTLFSYLYRDGSNSKVYKDIILKGKFRKNELIQIRQKLQDGMYFIPYQVGLPMPQFEAEWDLLEETDHPWVEINLESDIAETQDEATLELTCQDVAASFARVEWDELEASMHLGFE